MAISEVKSEHYETQLQQKKARMQSLFERFNPPDMELFRSPTSHYRMRAEFRVWHEGEDLDYVMFEPGNNKVRIKVTECLMVDRRIEGLMFTLLERIKVNPALRFKLFQVDFLATLSGELLVSLLYHRAIADEWVTAAKTLREALDIDIVGRSRKNKIVLDRDFVIEQLEVNGRSYRYKQTENSFTQPNAKVCEKMIAWALDVTQDAKDDLVEFYCGNGNFTLPLAQNFRRVIATEISKDSTRSAQFNIEQNQIENVDILRMSSEDFTQVLRGEKQSRRLDGIDLSSFNFSTILVDPPRAGLDAETLQQVQGYDVILYISCNPETLAENLDQLCKTHQIERFALFDQFPYTEHIECGVYLTKG